MGMKIARLIAFLIVALIFALVQFKGLTHIAPGDENVYFYMAKQVSGGAIPYMDFFYAHPPLHILILALLIKLFGLNFFILKSAELLALLTASFFLYKTSLEFFENRLNDKNSTLLSAIVIIVFLFSFEVLFKATFSMGINLSLMLVMISFYLMLKGSYFASGIFGGLAGLTRFYTLPITFAMLAYLLASQLKSQLANKKLKNFFYLFSGFLLVFGAAMLFFILLFGNNFFEPVVKYHFLKPTLPGQKFAVYLNVLKENWIIMALFFSSLFLKNKKEFASLHFIVLIYGVFLLLLHVPAEFYFSLAFPFMAVIGVYSLYNLIGKINFRQIRILLAVLAILIFLWNTAADAMFLENVGFLNFRPLPQLAAKISSANSEQQLFGDDSIIPLLALIANRSIAFNYIDSNEMRLTSGLMNFYLLTNKLDDANLSYIILREKRGMHQILEMREYAALRCKLDSKYSDPAEGVFIVYKC